MENNPSVEKELSKGEILARELADDMRHGFDRLDFAAAPDAREIKYIDIESADGSRSVNCVAVYENGLLESELTFSSKQKRSTIKKKYEDNTWDASSSQDDITYSSDVIEYLNNHLDTPLTDVGRLNLDGSELTDEETMRALEDTLYGFQDCARRVEIHSLYQIQSIETNYAIDGVDQISTTQMNKSHTKDSETGELDTYYEFSTELPTPTEVGRFIKPVLVASLSPEGVLSVSAYIIDDENTIRYMPIEDPEYIMGILRERLEFMVESRINNN